MTKIYETLSVVTGFQNCGSWWLLNLIGNEEEILLTFNGLFNLGATNNPDSLEWTDHNKTQALLWTRPEYMRKFFRARYILSKNRHCSEKMADAYAEQKFNYFKENGSMGGMFNFRQVHMPATFSMGTKSAERPDDNHRERMINKDYVRREEMEKETA